MVKQQKNRRRPLHLSWFKFQIFHAILIDRLDLTDAHIYQKTVFWQTIFDAMQMFPIACVRLKCRF